MSKINYDLWKNENGKVVIPDGVTTTWPEGDALVGNFIYNEGNLSGFVDTMALVANESKSTTIPYDYVDITVDKSLEGVMTFNRGERTKHFAVSYSENSGDTIVLGIFANCKTFYDVTAINPNYKNDYIIDGVWSESLENLEDNNPETQWGGGMFESCSSLSSFNSDLPSLTDGYRMFYYCTALTTFDSDLSSLENGEYMFCECSNLSSFNSDLSTMIDGGGMFQGCSNLTIISTDLSSLENGEYMFSECSNLSNMYYTILANKHLAKLRNGSHMFYSCRALTSFSYDLPNLVVGNNMFQNCVNLSYFNADLSNLTNGFHMFYATGLNYNSLQYIADKINDVNGLVTDWDQINTSIHFRYLDVINVQAFDKMVEKGWTVYVDSSENPYVPSDGGYDYYAASASLASTSFEGDGDMNSGMFSPIPFYAKPVSVPEKCAQYIDSEGNFYNILGAQHIYGDDLSTYGMFLSEDDAAMNMGLTKIEK